MSEMMPLDHKARFRVNSKQNTKGVWQMDITVEYDHYIIRKHDNPNDLGDVKMVSLGKMLQEQIRDCKKHIEADGWQVAGADEIA